MIRTWPLLIVFALLIQPARADDRGVQLVPEFNYYDKLSKRTRVYLSADVVRDIDFKTTDGDVGAHFDFTLKPILRRDLRVADWERDRYLWARIGYELSGSIDGREDGTTENRLMLETTGRAALPAQAWLVLRARVDFRNIDGTSSKRYRLRAGIEREFAAHGAKFVPYAEAENFYDTRYDYWTRWLYKAGVEIALSKAWRIECYVSRQNDRASASANVDAIGFVVKRYN